MWIAVVMATFLAWETWCVLVPGPVLRDRPIIVQIPPEEGALAVAARLKYAGAIRSPEAFFVLSLAHGSLRALKAGEYEVPRSASTPEVLALLETGRVRPHVVVHPEGATVAELARTLERAQLAPAAAMLRTATDPTFLRAHGIEALSVEGYPFPDTYQFMRGMTADQILGRMVERMHAKLRPDIRERARARKLTVHELLTFASIIEREAVARDEQRLISAVFWNRLQQGMPLQADPTVQYAHGKDRQRLRRADLLRDHPYNTYTRSGLPPGPIASPGLDAIEAALDPAPVGYLFFVKRDASHHYFSTTLDEHNQAIARYRASPAVGERRADPGHAQPPAPPEVEARRGIPKP